MATKKENKAEIESKTETEIKQQIDDDYKTFAVNLAKNQRIKKQLSQEKNALKRVKTVNENYNNDKVFINNLNEKLGIDGSIDRIESFKEKSPEVYFLLKQSVTRDKKSILKALE